MSEAVVGDVWSQYGEAFSAGGGGGYQKEWSTPDNGSIEIGIMTQMGPRRDDPEGWFAGHKVHWGYSIRRKDDPTKTRKITVTCLERRGKGGMIMEHDALCDKYEQQEQNAKDYEAQLRREKRSDEEVKNLMAPLNGWLKAFSRSNGVYLYAMNASGEFNKFRTSWKTFFQLRDKMNELEKSLKLNPRSPRNLVFWRITRTGSSKFVGQMSESVEPVRETVSMNGQVYEKIKIVALTEDQLRKGIEKYKDLGDVGAFAATHEQMRALAECNEDPEAVETILNIPQKINASSYTPAHTPAPVPYAPSMPIGRDPPAGRDGGIAQDIKSTGPEEDEEAALERKLVEARVRKAARLQAEDLTKATAAASPATPALPQPSGPGATSVAMADLLSRLKLSPQDIGQKAS